MTKEQLVAQIVAMEKQLRAMKNMLQTREVEASPDNVEFTGRIIQDDYRHFDIPRSKMGALL